MFTPVNNTYALQTPTLLQLPGPNGPLYGADQDWYPTFWQQNAGCGPTTLAHLVWYLANTRPGCEALAPGIAKTREGFEALMQDTWRHLPPTRFGVNKPQLFCRGATLYGEAHGVPLRCHMLRFSQLTPYKKALRHMNRFLKNALSRDLPVAFLNLGNGAEKKLDSWHWVTLVSYTPATCRAVMYDNGQTAEVDLALWLRTQRLGGGMAAVEPGGRPHTAPYPN